MELNAEDNPSFPLRPKYAVQRTTNLKKKSLTACQALLLLVLLFILNVFVGPPQVEDI